MLTTRDPENPNSCDQGNCLNYELWDIVTFVVDQSDGVVPAFSARNDGGAWRGHIVEAPGINHSEMLRFNDIDDTFNPIFNGVNTGNQGIFTIGN
jgi:hypothetical protein